MLNIVIPMAGLGSRFSSAGYNMPKPFIDICGKPMIQCVLENLNTNNCIFHLIVRSEHLQVYTKIFENLRKAFSINIITTDQVTEGMACSVLLARKYIDNENPLLLANSDQIIDFEISEMIKESEVRGLDGTILCFQDLTKNPKWSFVQLNEKKLVDKVAEKNPISNLATVGIYFFSQGKNFVDCAIDMIVRNERVNNEFYTCPVYNYAILNGLKIGHFEIPESAMHGVGTPEDLNAYLKFKKVEITNEI